MLFDSADRAYLRRVKVRADDAEPHGGILGDAHRVLVRRLRNVRDRVTLRKRRDRSTSVGEMFKRRYWSEPKSRG